MYRGNERKSWRTKTERESLPFLPGYQEGGWRLALFLLQPPPGAAGGPEESERRARKDCLVGRFRLSPSEPCPGGEEPLISASNPEPNGERRERPPATWSHDLEQEEGEGPLRPWTR